MMLPLALAAVGSRVRVSTIRTNDRQKVFLEGLGFVPDALLTIVSSHGGNTIVEIRNTRVALGREFTSHIFCEELKDYGELE